MTRDELIKQCRYYKGEEECPFDDSKYPQEIAWYWDMERVFVKNEGVLLPMHSDYECMGGKRYKCIPYALLIVMFTSWGKYTYDLKKSLPSFYELVDGYLESGVST